MSINNEKKTYIIEAESFSEAAAQLYSMFVKKNPQLNMDVSFEDGGSIKLRYGKKKSSRNG
jgi:hypothetical protein